MSEHTIGTREEWQAARDELAKLEAEHAELGQKVTEQRRQLPWVPVEKEYRFDTEDGKKTLAELFDGRSQLLAYNIMFGPDYELGACPGCSNLGDELDATRVHLNHRDVTLICFSRAPIDRLIAYKQRMGWQLPYVSTYGTDFPSTSPPPPPPPADPPAATQPPTRSGAAGAGAGRSPGRPPRAGWGPPALQRQAPPSGDATHPLLAPFSFSPLGPRKPRHPPPHTPAPAARGRLPLVRRPPNSVEDRHRVEVVTPATDLAIRDREHRDVPVGVGSSGRNDPTL